MIEFAIEGQAFVPVPTVFLKEYMCDAPQDYVKVYLYGLCLAQEGGSAQDVDIEEALHMTIAQISDALKYWEQKGFVKKEGARISYTQPEKKRTAPAALNPALYLHRDYNRKLDALLSRPLSHTELDRIHDYTETFGLPHEVVLLMIENCVAARGKNISVAYLDKVARDWADEGINTTAKAREKIADYGAANGGARALLRVMGITGKNPDAAQQELYAKWTQKWGFTQESIQFAMKGIEFPAGAPFKYLDAILRNLYENGKNTSGGISEFNEARERRISGIKDVMRALDYSRMGIRPSHERFYDEWERAGYSRKKILLACKQSAENNSRRFESVDAFLREWVEKGITTEEEIERLIEQRDKQKDKIKQVYGCAGIKKSINDADRKWYDALTTEHKMDHDVLMFAADLSSLANDPMSFLRKVLSDWAKIGVTTLKSAREQNLNRYAGDMKNKKAFEQHAYTDEDLERRRFEAVNRLADEDE